MTFGRLHFPNEHITGDRLKAGCDARFEIGHNPSHTRMLSVAKRIYCKTDYIEEAFAAIRQRETPCILVTHNSDFPITERLWIRKPTQVIKWYAINTEIREPNLVPIPLGCENMRSPGYSGNMMVIERLIARKPPKNYLAFINFNIRTSPNEREPIIDLFANQPWAKEMGYGLKFEQCMTMIRGSKFVFCPRGNGLDTHRMWESLYLGAIPIVKRCLHMEAFAESLPILLIDRWSDVTKDMLDEVWESWSKTTWNMEKACLVYWKKRFRTGDGLLEKNGKNA